MKKTFNIIVALSCIAFLFSCGNEKEAKEEKVKKAELTSKKAELSSIKISNPEDKVSKEFIQADNLYRFSELLSDFLLKLKNEEYSSFCQKLETVANKKWKAFTNSNTQKPVTQKNWDKCFFYG